MDLPSEFSFLKLGLKASNYLFSKSQYDNFNTAEYANQFI